LLLVNAIFVLLGTWIANEGNWIVETSDKKRFSFDDTGNLIRANQSHSIEGDLRLEEREPPEVLY